MLLKGGVYVCPYVDRERSGNKTKYFPTQHASNHLLLWVHTVQGAGDPGRSKIQSLCTRSFNRQIQLTRYPHAKCSTGMNKVLWGPQRGN